VEDKMKYAKYVMALVVALPVSGFAQAGPGNSTGPVARVLAHRSELSLTADQVKQLKAIDGKYAEKDRELIGKVETLRGRPVGVPLRMRDMPAAEREKLLANQAQLRPLMQQLRTSHAAAISELQTVLTAEQNTRAAAYLYPGRAHGPGRGGWRGPGRAGLGFGSGRMAWRAGW
jgi:hypothetical protein